MTQRGLRNFLPKYLIDYSTDALSPFFIVIPQMTDVLVSIFGNCFDVKQLATWTQWPSVYVLTAVKSSDNVLDSTVAGKTDS
jgi:hypothetical protein